MFENALDSEKSFNTIVMVTSVLLKHSAIRVTYCITIVQKLKEQGCASSDQRIASILRFVKLFVTLQVSNQDELVAQLVRTDFYALYEYLHAPDKPATKSYQAVLKALLRFLQLPSDKITQFAKNRRVFHFMKWNAHGAAKVQEMRQSRAGRPSDAAPAARAFFAPAFLQAPPPSIAAGVTSPSGSIASVAHGHPFHFMTALPPVQQQSSNHVTDGSAGANAAKPQEDLDVSSSRGTSGVNAGHSSTGVNTTWQPAYDILHCAETASYYVRVFMPLCDFTLVQPGISIDLLHGMLHINGRYEPVLALPVWVGTHLKVTKAVPGTSARHGPFSLNISLPSDVDFSTKPDFQFGEFGLLVTLRQLRVTWDPAAKVEYRLAPNAVLPQHRSESSSSTHQEAPLGTGSLLMQDHETSALSTAHASSGDHLS